MSVTWIYIRVWSWIYLLFSDILMLIFTHGLTLIVTEAYTLWYESLLLQHFVHATFCPWDILSMRPFVRATFCPCDEFFATFCPQHFVRDDMSATICPATNCPATICPCDILSATICPRPFVLRHSVLALDLFVAWGGQNFGPDPKITGNSARDEIPLTARHKK